MGSFPLEPEQNVKKITWTAAGEQIVRGETKRGRNWQEAIALGQEGNEGREGLNLWNILKLETKGFGKALKKSYEINK